MDATIHSNLAAKYDVRGYPTIKVFSQNGKSVIDYPGERSAEAIVKFATEILESNAAPSPVEQITDATGFSAVCEQKNKICVLMIMPHIYDSSARVRNGYIDQLRELARIFRGKPLLFGWLEGGAQPALERALETNDAYPSLSLLSTDRRVYNTMRVSWSEKNARVFINGVLSRT